MLYLLRLAEAGREAQTARGKIRRDVAGAVRTRVPGARVTTASGRVFVDVDGDGGPNHPAAAVAVEAVLGDIYGVVSYSPCVPCDLHTLDTTAIEAVRDAARTAGSFRVRVKCANEPALSARELEVRLGAAVAGEHPQLSVDLANPELELGVEVRDGRCYVFTEVIPGLDRRTDVDAPALAEPRFLVDHMLGPLVAWLRILGFDTIFAQDQPDSWLLRTARREGRVILTRDRPLADIQAANIVFVHTRELVDQIREIAAALALSLRGAAMFTRCTLCNARVRPVAAGALADRVPAEALAEYDEFTECAPCDKVYWKGGQYQRILVQLADLVDAE